MVHAGSKSGKKGKGKGGSSGGGRWSGNLRPDRWNPPRDKWKSSPDSWSSSSSSSKSKDSDSDNDPDPEDSDSDDKKPECTLANPVQEQYEIIVPTWTKAFLNNANQEESFQRTVTWHANMVMEKFMKVVEGYNDDDYDKDDMFDLGEIQGSSHPNTAAFKLQNFNGEDKEDGLCAQTKALVLMMKESCFYSRWKKTLEIAAYYYMNGFLDGAGADLKLSKCIDEPKLPKEKKSNKRNTRKNDDDEEEEDSDDDDYDNYYDRRHL